MKNKLYPNTLVKKCVYVICTVTAVLLLLASGLVSHWVSQLLKPELCHNLSVLTSSISVKISYILHQNTQYLGQFWEDEAFLDDVLDYTLLSDPDERETESLVSRLEEEVYGNRQSGAITSTRNVLIVADGDVLLCNSRMEAYGKQILESPWFSYITDFFQGSPPDVEYSSIDYSPVFPENAELGIEEFIALAMYRSYNNHEFLFIMVEPFEDFRLIFNDFLAANITDFCLVGHDERILYQNKTDSLFAGLTAEEIGSLFVEEQYAAGSAEMQGNLLIGVRASFDVEQLKLTVGLSDEELLAPYQSFIHLFNAMLTAFTVILISAVILILNRSLKNLKHLAAQMQNVHRDNYHISKNIHSKDEIGMLAGTFYELMDQIQRNIEKIRRQEEKEKRIEYSLMLSQIDPHFIYNTLDTITCLAELNRVEDIMVINKSLISMLRDRLKMTCLQIYDTPQNEKRQLLSYITIQKYLCNSELSMEFWISPECSGLDYPKNIIQPLVENAIIHGLLLHRDEEGKLIPGCIEVRIYREGESVITEIKDNGVGMAPEAIRRYFEAFPEDSPEPSADSRRHIGIYNIRMRLNYLYGDRFQIHAVSPDTGGLSIVLRFPFSGDLSIL